MISSVRTLALHLRNVKPTCVGISPAKPLPATSCVHTDNCIFFFLLAECKKAVAAKCTHMAKRDLETIKSCRFWFSFGNKIRPRVTKMRRKKWGKKISLLLRNEQSLSSAAMLNFSCSQMHLETHTFVILSQMAKPHLPPLASTGSLWFNTEPLR